MISMLLENSHSHIPQDIKLIGRVRNIRELAFLLYIYIYMAFVELVVIIGKHALVGIVKAQLGMYSLLVC